MNALGKTLVMINTLLAILALVWSTLLYLHPRDLGKLEPRKEYDYHVPSEIDKRMAALLQAYRYRDVETERVMPAKAKSETENLADIMKHITPNRFFYEQELTKLKSGLKEIEVCQLKLDANGMPELDVPKYGKPILGPPEMNAEMPPKKITQTLEMIAKESKDLKNQFSELSKEALKTIEQSIEITIKVNGDTFNGNNSRGLLDVREEEAILKRKLEEEKIYLLPILADIGLQVDNFIPRKLSLERTLYALRQRWDELQPKK